MQIGRGGGVQRPEILLSKIYGKYALVPKRVKYYWIEPYVEYDNVMQ